MKMKHFLNRFSYSSYRPSLRSRVTSLVKEKLVHQTKLVHKKDGSRDPDIDQAHEIDIRKGYICGK